MGLKNPGAEENGLRAERFGAEDIGLKTVG